MSARPRTVAAASLLVDIVLLTAKLVVGLATGSLGMLSEAAHSALDLIASTFALVALRTAAKPADPEHPYGHGRAENLAAFAEGIVLVVTALAITYEALLRLFGHPAAVDPAWYAIALASVTIGIELVRATVLTRTARATGSPALHASAQNRIADIAASFGVLLGLIGVRLGLPWADAVAALLVAGVIGRAAVVLVWRSGDILIDRAPSGIQAGLRTAIAAVPGVHSVGPVRVRRSGSRLLADATVSARRLMSVEGSGALGQAVREAVARTYPELELTLVIEADQGPATMVERVHTTASGDSVIRDLHNVTVEREQDGSLHLSMHAKLPGEMTLAAATASSAQLERALRAEFPDAERIDIHLEPLEPDLVSGLDVTGERPYLVARIRSIVSGHPRVLAGGDVELSAREGRLIAHVVATMAGDVTLEDAHQVETELEDRLRAEVPEIYEVVARVEPSGG